MRRYWRRGEGRAQAQREHLPASNDRTVGTWKTGNENNAAARRGGWETITILYPGESGGTVLMKQAHKPVEGRPPVGNSSLIFDRAPCAVKTARTVLSGGKSREKNNETIQHIIIKGLPIAIWR